MTLTTPTGAPPTIDVPRDRHGQPLIIVEGKDRPVPYTRASKIGKALTDDYSLTQWKKRQVALGLAKRADLLTAVAAAHDDKDALDKLCEEAMEAAGATAAAIMGTALHALSETVDTGGELSEHTPPAARSRIGNYLDTIRAARLVPHAAETFVVCDELRVAGTFDRLYLTPNGKTLIGDVKGLALTTPLPTPTGWTTMAAVTVGDQLIGSDGTPCTVTAKSEVKRIGTWVVRFDDGSDVVCDTEHIWWTRAGWPMEPEPTAKGIGEIIATLRRHGQAHHRVPLAEPLDLPDADLPIDPYLLGCWLGDGAARGGTITKGSDLFDVLLSDGHRLGVEQRDARRPHVISRSVVGLTAALRANGLLHDKHVPDTYLRASARQRLRLVQGLMDTDGTWNTARHDARFTTTEKRLACAIEELLLGLGQRPHVAEVVRRGFGVTVLSYDVRWRPRGMAPFRLPRKAAKVTVRPSRGYRVITSVEPGPDVDTACVAVDSPNRTYLCGPRMIPTHNTGGLVDARGRMYQSNAVEYAVQLAVYAHGQRYDPATGQRTPLHPDLDPTRGIVVHLPAQGTVCTLIELDLVLGWALARLAREVLDVRNTKALATPRFSKEQQ